MWSLSPNLAELLTTRVPLREAWLAAAAPLAHYALLHLLRAHSLK